VNDIDLGPIVSGVRTLVRRVSGDSLVAMAATASTLTTADELLRMQNDSLRRELIRGELRVMAPGGFEHGRRAARIARLLDVHASQTGTGVAIGAETGFVLSRDPDTVRAPDAAFISRERFEAVGNTAKYWPGAPDFAVEVVSPEDTSRYVREKALEWIAAGCVAVLVLDSSKRTATVYRAGGEAHVHGVDETLDLHDAVPGFSVPVAELFG
jgi:Uma2 family endonuclease